MKTSEVQEILKRAGVHFHSISKRKDVFTIRKTYFYTHGGSSEKFKDRVVAAIPNVKILEHFNNWAPFSGGSSVANSSHWCVKFSIL